MTNNTMLNVSVVMTVDTENAFWIVGISGMYM